MCLIVQSGQTLCDPMGGSPSGSSVRGDSSGKNTGVVAIPISRGSSQPRDETQVYLLCRQILYHLSYQGSPRKKRGGLTDYCRFSSLSGMGSELLFKVVICVKWLVSLKILKSITFLKIHPGSMLISFKISQILNPLTFPRMGKN